MNIDVNNYTYQLPPEKIARYPLAQRDQSKLLYYTTGKIEHKKFTDLPELLPPGSTLFFNDTKVIPARLIFQKTSGAHIEIFLLNPIEPSSLLVETLQAREACVWKCTIGNLKKWTVDTLSKSVNGMQITAKLVDREGGVVKFTWSGGNTFAEIVQYIGNTPLPPYLNRDADATDVERYQTVYSRREGAVAAPTAGLHFTPAVLGALQEKRIHLDFLSLHVSAGTFLPIKVINALDHRMHEEQMVINRQNIKTLLEAKTIVAVGTTSLRTLESLYWYGVKLIRDQNAEFNIGQHDPYTHGELPTALNALKAIQHHMDIRKKETLTGETSIYIVPGYRFRLCSGLITNFHQPSSTLILLVAAFIGGDWRKVYDEALANDYRFLSYGDSSLLLSHNPLF
jgi:S-adenosylmethionine:tRNA ribosyltransferase-isomerase